MFYLEFLARLLEVKCKKPINSKAVWEFSKRYVLNIGNPPICSFYELLFWAPDSGPQQKELKIVTISSHLKNILLALSYGLFFWTKKPPKFGSENRKIPVLQFLKISDFCQGEMYSKDLLPPPSPKDNPSICVLLISGPSLFIHWKQHWLNQLFCGVRQNCNFILSAKKRQP